MRRDVHPPDLKRAACRGMDPDLFYSEGEADERRAKEICDICPEIVPCRVFGLYREEFGILGGMTAKERAAWRRANGVRLERLQVIR